jgi:hypothetical protein
MATTEQNIDNFAQFAKELLGNGGAELSIDELYDRWRQSESSAEDAHAIQASLRDMENGETGQPYEEFADEFRKRNGIPDSA